MSDQKESSKKTINTKALIICITTFVLGVLAILFISSYFWLEGGLGRTIRVIFIVLMALLGILLVNLVVFFSSLKVIDEQAKIIAQGNLNVSNIILEKARGLENLTLALNDMKANFLSFIELTKGNIVTLSDAIGQVSSGIEMNYTGNEQIAASMGVVSEKAQQQLDLVRETIAGVENCNTRIEKVTESIKYIEEYIAGTAAMTENGTKNLELFYDKLNHMSENLDDTNQFMQDLNDEIGKISSIGEFIIQISEQLKLLSLNASIEAARAGEAGKGFAVVSNEIRDLSSKTQESMKKIDVIVNEVMKSSENVYGRISGFINSFNENKELFSKVKDTIQTINQKSSNLTKDMKGLYNEINQIGTFTSETKEKGMVLQVASDEISSSTQDVAAVTEEVLAGLEGINTQASALNNMLTKIRNLVKRFNTSVLPVEQVSPKPFKLACLSFVNNEFWDSIQRGAIYAKKELEEKNVTVDFFGYTGGEPLGDWTVKRIRECMDNGYRGIALPGFIAEAIPVIEEANKRNVIIMAFNCDFPENTARMAVFGPNNYEGGKLAGNAISKAMNYEGNLVIFRGGSDVAESRKKGILDAIKKSKKINVVEDIVIHDVAENVYTVVKDYLADKTDLQGICIAGGGVEGAAKALEELGLANRIQLVGFEHTQEIFNHIKKGNIYASIGQDTFGQGHDPIIWMYNCIMTGEKTPSEVMYLRSDVVDSSNVNDLIVID